MKSPSKQDIAIKVENLGKCYHLYEKPIHRALDLILPGASSRYKPFWALKGANFEILSGQTVGIIGRNGSGKSTLLEIICNTLSASEGEVLINGRIAALLELGAGFNPEFTGRENVYMNAAIMGIDQAVIDAKFAEIEGFANIGEHINYPVKTYSSGMFVRLAFATSINMDPDVLVIDEALAVGDMRFQRKCFREIERFKQLGKTILFVTHAVDLVSSYCDSAIFLHEGKIIRQGEPREVVYDYLDMLFGSEDHAIKPKTASPQAHSEQSVINESNAQKRKFDLNTDPNLDGAKLRRSYSASEYRWGEGQAKIIDYVITSEGVNDPVVLKVDKPFYVHMRVYFFQALDSLIYGLTIKTREGVTVYGTNTRERKIKLSSRKQGECVDISFKLENHLIPGGYFISLGVAQDNDNVDNLAIDRRYDLFSIVVDGEVKDFGIANLNMLFEEKSVAR